MGKTKLKKRRGGIGKEKGGNEIMVGEWVVVRTF